MLELEEYNIKLQHVPGKNNSRADALSRRPDYDQGAADNQNITVLPDRMFIRALASQELEQNEEVLKPWVDPHKLKQISGTWWKGDQLVLLHGRDVHLTWVKSFTKTLGNGFLRFCSTRAKSKEDFDSY